MSLIFISGFSTGLGLMAVQLLAAQGHGVVLRARNIESARDARADLFAAMAIVVGNLETIAGAKDVAEQVNAIARFDAIIHNAALGYREAKRTTVDGLPHVFAVNALSAYILTALIERLARLIYLSSGLHLHTDANLDDMLWERRPWSGSTAYSETKLHDPMLAFAIANRWKDLCSNALEPGWVPTKMGGAGARTT